VNDSDNNPMAVDIASRVQSLKAEGAQFAMATVVRTISVTAAKPGAKAIIDANGEIIDGWIGGGCAKSAVVKAAVQSIGDGEPKLVSLAPEEFLAEMGLSAGEEVDGVLAANNMCPSKGSMDIFIEPYLCEPELLILGASPVARMLASLAEPFAFNVSCGCSDPSQWEAAVHYDELRDAHDHRYIVVATQGGGDVAALKKALSMESEFISFVGSGRKTQHLKKQLGGENFSAENIAAIKGPAGLDIGGVTPQEIALSILAELVAVRRTNRLPSLSA